MGERSLRASVNELGQETKGEIETGGYLHDDIARD
jgi:hypothetical protein